MSSESYVIVVEVLGQSLVFSYYAVDVNNWVCSKGYGDLWKG